MGWRTVSRVLSTRLISDEINARAFQPSRRKLSDVIIGSVRDTHRAARYHHAPPRRFFPFSFLPMSRAVVAFVISFVHLVPSSPRAATSCSKSSQPSRLLCIRNFSRSRRELLIYRAFDAIAPDQCAPDGKIFAARETEREREYFSQDASFRVSFSRH